MKIKTNPKIWENFLHKSQQPERVVLSEESALGGGVDARRRYIELFISQPARGENY